VTWSPIRIAERDGLLFHFTCYSAGIGCIHKGDAVMSAVQKFSLLFVVCVCFASLSPAAYAQGGSVSGTVKDPSGAVVANATVEIHNLVSAFDRSATTDSSGNFTFANVPYNPYHLSVSAKGFAAFAQDVDIRSSVPVSLSIKLQLAGSSTTVTVEGGSDLIENDPTTHTDIDRQLFDKLALESQSSELSSLVTLASPGVAADSNGLFHGLGDHAENSFSVDGQPITDQQSKVFSNQLPLDAVQSLEVIEGAPPAEYGDKTSLVINVTTRSGLGVTTPHGSVTASYGTFGTSNAGFDLQYGGQKWGNFISASGLNSGRFLDPPEFTVIHDKGNEENIFDRVDYKLSSADSIHLNAQYTRSWFQTPNSFDSEFASPWFGVVVDNNGLGPNGLPVGPTDQRSKIGTFDIAPTWDRLLGSSAVFEFGGFVRRDAYNYYPSGNPFADLGPVNLQQETLTQYRTLTNAGARSSISYSHGMHNIKGGVVYEQTFLRENDTFGIVDPTFLSSFGCPNATIPQCATLLPFDLTQGGGLFTFHGQTDVKELALYLQDTISWKNWAFNVGIRGDFYNGISKGRQAEPRLGIAYNVKQTNTVLRVSYARSLETPFNENLVLSSTGCSNPVVGALFFVAGEGCGSANGVFSPVATPLSPGFRNEFHAGLQQAFGKYFVVDGEYIWKYTHNGYDFSVLGATPVTFPIEWNNSKIPGYAIRTSVPNYHGLTALVVMSSVAARFFEPQIGGVGAVPITPGSFAPFRIDHDEKFNLSAHLQYQPWKRGPWFGFNWRYDSGLVAGAAPCSAFTTGGTLGPGTDCPQSFEADGVTPVTINGQPAILLQDAFGVPLSADQEAQGGFTCNGVHALPPSPGNPVGTPLPNPCLASQFGSTLIQVPRPGTENDDLNPPRIASRNLFDVTLGDDNLFHGEKYRWSARVTIINITNEYALYNFLSTFSGTHYVTPRAVTGQIGFHF
jgi:Carboxypeptidase regulatory-like domain